MTVSTTEPKKRIVDIDGLLLAFPFLKTKNAIRLRVFKRQLPFFKMPSGNQLLFDIDVVEAYLTSQPVATREGLLRKATEKKTCRKY